LFSAGPGKQSFRSYPCTRLLQALQRTLLAEQALHQQVAYVDEEDMILSHCGKNIP